MDQSTTIISYIGFATGVLSTIYAIINRGHIRSRCCGRELEASIVIDKLPESPAAPPQPPIKSEQV